MKIKTAEDVERLDAKIKEELGVDVQKYKNEEVAEKFVELLVFPRYVVNWATRPLIVFLILYLIGFFVVDLVNIEYLIYGLVGLGLFAVSGLLFGYLFLTWKIKSDFLSIIDYSLGIMKSCVVDLDQVHSKITGENRTEVLGLLFKGVIHIVTIPVMSKVIAEKVPFVGGFLQGIAKKVLTLVSEKVQFDEVLLEEELKEEKEENRFISKYTQLISLASNGINRLLSITIGIAQIPVLIAFVFTILILAIFLFLIW